ncbi:hypothetical protein [Vibrio mediterranei]|uniref:hypothetical protein n=1 Tax=Vibrio mediterranei TaxID=689 RepID=UPI0040688592
MRLDYHPNTLLVTKGQKTIKAKIAHIEFEEHRLSRGGPMKSLTDEQVELIHKTYKRRGVGAAEALATEFGIETTRPFANNFAPLLLKDKCEYCGVPLVQSREDRSQRHRERYNQPTCALCLHRVNDSYWNQLKCSCRNCTYMEELSQREVYIPARRDENELSDIDIIYLHWILSNSELLHLLHQKTNPPMQANHHTSSDLDTLIVKAPRYLLTGLKGKVVVAAINHLYDRGYLIPYFDDESPSQLDKIYGVDRDLGATIIHQDDIYIRRNNQAYLLQVNGKTIDARDKYNALKRLETALSKLTTKNTLSIKSEYMTLLSHAITEKKACTVLSRSENAFAEAFRLWHNSIKIEDLEPFSISTIERAIDDIFNPYEDKILPEEHGFDPNIHVNSETVELANSYIYEQFIENLSRNLNQSEVKTQPYRKEHAPTLYATLNKLLGQNSAPSIHLHAEHEAFFLDRIEALYTKPKAVEPKTRKPKMQPSKPMSGTINLTEDKLENLLYEAMLYGHALMAKDLTNIDPKVSTLERKKILVHNFLVQQTHVPAPSKK